jgi:hypothetical protein
MPVERVATRYSRGPEYVIDARSCSQCGERCDKGVEYAVERRGSYVGWYCSLECWAEVVYAKRSND